MALQVRTEFFTADAHPSVRSCGIAIDESVVGHVVCHHGPCPDKGVSPDSHTTDNGTVCSQCCSAFYPCGAGLIHLAYVRTRGPYVGKNHAGATEDIVIESDTLIYADIVLNFTPLAYGDIGSDDHILSDAAIRADD